MVQDWNIRPRSHVCCTCQRPFADGEVYHTRLTFGAEGYARVDCCQTCWAQAESVGGQYSAWKGVFRVPPPEPERKVTKETAESLLRALVEAHDATRAAVIYILAVMLERQRVFVEREARTEEDGGRRVIYEHRRTGETFLVRDPQLRLDQIDAVQQEVMRLLTVGAPAPASAAEPAAPATNP